MNWYNEFGWCMLMDGLVKGKSPLSQMRINRAFYEASNRPITKLSEGCAK